MADLYDLNRIREYVNNPSAYTDYTAKAEPNTYLGVPVYQAFMSIYGREPTQQELAQYAPLVRTVGHTGVQSEIANAYNAEQNTPDKLAAKQNEANLAAAPKHYSDVTSLFQSALGRAPTQDELQHFGSLLASGTTDAYGLQQFLQQQPEYTTKQNQDFQNQLSGQLAGYDQQYFQNQILPSIQETFAKQGRSFDSSAFKNAATQSAQQQNVQRQNFLAGLSASQYQGVQNKAYNDYINQVQNQQALTNAGINAQYQGILNANNRVNTINDYQTQAQLYNQYLAKYGNRNPTAYDYTNLALNGVKTAFDAYNSYKQAGSY